MSDERNDLKRTRWVLVVAIALVAFNLRPALASVGPVVEEIRAATGLSSVALGMLTTLPLLAFGFLSLFASAVSERVGLERAIGFGLLLIAGGTALRAVPGAAPLFVGTGILGVGVALGNVLIPALAKRGFPSKPGPITSLYSSMMAVGAALAAGLSVPLAGMIGWRAALGAWCLPAVLALVVWIPRVRTTDEGGGGRSRAYLGQIVRSPLAWQVALYMGLQSMSFYVLLAWLPAFLQSQGLSEGAAGGLLALTQVTGIAGSAAIPVWAGGAPDQRSLIWALSTGEAVGLVGLLFTGPSLATLWVLLLGFILGGTFALALTFLAVRTPDAASAGALSGMAQSVGYLLAAAGPPLFGWVHDLADGWTVPLAGLLGVLLAKTLTGLHAARPEVLEVGATGG